MLNLALIIPRAKSITAPSFIARSIARGGAQIPSKLRFGGLKTNLNKTYKRYDLL